MVLFSIYFCIVHLVHVFVFVLFSSYSSITAIQNKNMSYAQYGVPTIKKQRTEEEYFNDDDEEDKDKDNKAKGGADMPYQPAPGSPGPPDAKKNDDDSDSEEDPLDAFMANLESEAKSKGLKSGKTQAKEAKAGTSSKATSSSKTSKGVRDDIEEEDDEEQYYKWMEENPNAGRSEPLALKLIKLN